MRRLLSTLVAMFWAAMMPGLFDGSGKEIEDA
jgi:hypothetical protein